MRAGDQLPSEYYQNDDKRTSGSPKFNRNTTKTDRIGSGTNVDNVGVNDVQNVSGSGGDVVASESPVRLSRMPSSTNNNWKRKTRSATVYHQKNTNPDSTIPLVSNRYEVEEQLFVRSADIKEMESFMRVKWKIVLTRILIILFFPLYFILKRFKRLHTIMTCDPAPFSTADSILILDSLDKYSIQKVKVLKIDEKLYSGPSDSILQGVNNNNFDEDSANQTGKVEYRMFEFLHLRYIYDPSVDSFVVQHMDPYDILSSGETTSRTGLDSDTHRRRLIQFGSNHINIKSEKKIKAFIKEAKRLLYIIQYMTIILWLFRERFLYFAIAFVVCLSSLIIGTLQKSQSRKLLKRLVNSTAREIRVIRDGESFMTGSAGLVPGDLVEITGRFTLPCDLVLLSGSVEVDESTITGDTVAAHKVAYDISKESKRKVPFFQSGIQQDNKLIGGTKVLSVKPMGDNKSALAVVIRTGFNSSKGKIIRSVLLSQRVGHRHPYISDVEKYSLMMAFFGLLTVFMGPILFGVSPSRIPNEMRIINFFDALLVTVPPFLSLLYKIPISSASRRLKASEIQATNVLDIMKFGILDCICYDKTGTLTQDYLGLYGVVETKQYLNTFTPVITQITEMSENTINIMASCHNLTRVNEKVFGDRLEEELFRQVGYELKREKSEKHFIVHPPPQFNDRGMIQVTTIFPFSPILRRMSVVTRFPTFCIYSKGSPKSIQSICKAETIPKDFEETVKNFGLKGFRIIAMAKRELPEDMFFQNLSRESAEQDMIFLGFLIMHNRLHPETVAEIELISQNKIRTPMVTGDTIYTAISASKECRIIPPESRVLMTEVEEDSHTGGALVIWKEVLVGNGDMSDENTELAITGPAFALLRNHSDLRQRAMYYKLLVRTNIYAEMLPNQKAELIKDLQEMNYVVGMVGDGSNDSMALSSADVGLSISEAETSFAAQFTCETKHCMSFMILDSRALLEKINQNFKFVFVFLFLHLCTIFHSKMFSESQMIWTVISVLLIVFSMSTSNPLKSIDKQRPPKRILRYPLIISVLIQCTIQLLFLTLMLFILDQQDWIREVGGNNFIKSELFHSVQFMFFNFQVLSIAIAFNFNTMYIVPWKNWLFMLISIFLLVVNILILWPFPSNIKVFDYIQHVVWWIVGIFQQEGVPSHLIDKFFFMRLATLIFIALDIVVSFAAEFTTQKLFHFFASRKRLSHSNLMYRRVMSSVPSLKMKLKKL